MFLYIVRDGDKKNIRDKLKKLMSRRPTLDELHKKGIMKGNVTYCWLKMSISFHTICCRENVFKFVDEFTNIFPLNVLLNLMCF